MLPMVGGLAARRKVNAHKFQLEVNEHYVEEQWCSIRLFEEIKFSGDFILDPCCGWGRIAGAARRAKYAVRASDIIDRRAQGKLIGRKVAYRTVDFLGLHDETQYQWWQGGSIVCNPPFKLIKQFYDRAISLSHRGRYVAFVCPTRRLAAATWLRETPLIRVLMMNPRPSMPTGEFILAAERGDIDPETGEPFKVGGGSQDFCWLIWRKGEQYIGAVDWLLRDG